MEEWSRKLKLLHWMCIERADGVSPLICRDDDDDDGDSGAGETFEGGSAFEGGFDTGGGNAPDGSSQETFEGGANFDSSPGGTQDSGTQETFEGGANFDSSPGGSGTGGGSNESVNDFASLDNSPAQGYADYGSNVEQGLGGAASASGAAAAGTAAGTAASQGTSSDFLSSSQPDPNVPDVPGREFNIAGLAAQPGKEDKEDKEVTPATPGLNIYDQPMGPPNTKELEQEFQREFQQQFEQQQKEQQDIPANAVPTGYNAPYGSQQLDINAFVGPSQKEQSQWAPSSTTQGLTPEQVAQSNQWDIGPTTAVNAFGVGPTANPFAGPANVWDFPTPTQQAAPTKEEQNPWDQQTAFNTFGFNPTTPQGYNMPAAISGQQTPDQQVATGQPNAVQTTGFIAPSPTAQVTREDLPPAVPTGKADQLATGRDPFSNKDPWNPDYFAPPVGMLMANVPTAPQSSLQEWPTPDKPGTPFGPQAPTQAAPQAVAQGPQAPQGQAPTPTYDQVFNTTPIAQQSANLFDLPVGTKGPNVPGREERERDRPENREPLVVGKAPDPSVIIDTSARNSPPWSTVPAPTVNAPAAPPVEVATPTPEAPRGGVSVAIQDASGNTAVPAGYAPDPQAGNPLAGGVPPGGSTVELPSSQQGGGAGPIIPAVLTAAQREMDRRKRTSQRLPQTAQEKRDAITEALMRRDLNAPGVSDFDRLRLQP